MSKLLVLGLLVAAACAGPSVAAPTTPMPTAGSSASPPPAVVTTSVTATRGCYRLAVRNDGARFVTVVPSVRVDEVAITDRNGGILVEATSSPDGKNELRRPYIATAAPGHPASPSGTPDARYTIEVGLAVWNDFAQVAGPSTYEVRVFNHGSGANQLPLDGQCAGK